MVSDLLLEAFGQMVSQAGDVGRLNAAILQLAVQGKLVAQDPNDEPASELLKRIAAEKKRLKTKSEPLPEIGEEERPFALPNGWEWARLGDVISLEYGNGLTAKNRDRSGDVPVYGSNGVVGFHSEAMINQDCIVVGRKGSSGAVNLALGNSWIIDTAYYVIPPQETDLLFIFRLLQSLKLDRLGKGIKPGLNRNEAYQLPFPLPPLAEQKRIVERVDALLAQTRELESRLSQAETTLTALHETAVNTLLSATDPDDFTARWQFIAENFNLLYDETYPETAVANIAQLKQAILQLAVQGKLTHQEPQDEPASALLQRIAAEKERLGIKSKELAEIGEGERPYALPDGWEWVYVEEACERIVDCLHSTAKFKSSGFMCIDTNSIRPGKIIYEKIRYVDERTFHERNRRMVPQANDVLFSREGALLGIAVTVPENIEFCLGQRMMIFRLPESIDSKYFETVLNSPVFKNQYQKHVTGSASPHLNIRDIRKSIIPFPPLEEQKRIVTRVSALLRLCDDLSAHIQEAQATRAALRDAVLGS